MSEPQTFGKYRLVRRLAFGGMAEIFLARLVGDQGFEKTVVLKRILPQLSSDPDFTRMFIDEAVLAARLTHPNVAQIYDFGEVDGTYFITMEHVDGADLRKVIRAAYDRNRGLTAVEVAAVGEGMARGLAYVHDLVTDDGKPLSIVHRDVSPHNVMLTRGGDVKVMDFGIAKAAARATHTATGTIKGKLAYMAPEQALAEQLDNRADQYAVGLTLWECLTGRRVFEGDSEPELLSRVAAGRVPDLRSIKPEVPDALSRIIMRMLSVPRGERYPSLREVEQELAAFRFGLGAAGVARLSGLVDELVPREPVRSATPERVTAVLPADGGVSAPTPQRMSTSSHSAAQADLSMEQGWLTSVGSTAPTFEPPAAPPTRAGPTVINPPRRSPMLLLGLLGSMALGGVGAGFAMRRAQAPTTESRSPTNEDRQPTTENRLPTTEDRPPTPEDRFPTTDPSPPTDSRPTKSTSAKAGHAKGTGFVSLRSRGSWAEVFMNGKSLGNTPLRRVEVPAGIVTLELRGAGGGHETLTLDVPAGDHVQRTVEIR